MAPILPLIPFLVALSPTARCDERTVLVTPFQTSDRSVAGLAALLASYLEQELDRHPALRALPLQEVDLVHEMPAEMYVASCPPGEHVGCAFVVGEVANADFAVSGTVAALDDGTLVEIHVVLVREAREVVSFQVALGTGEDEKFATGVVRILDAVARGEIGQVRDVREGDEAPAEDYDAVSAELDELGREIGDVTTIDVRAAGRIERPKFTMDDLAERMEEEGAKPWERLDMAPMEYMRFKNSGVDIRTWRTRAQGRKQQVLVRPLIGFVRGPVDARYYGRYARSEENLQVVETYAFHAAEDGGAVWVGGSGGYGLTPALEVGAVAGITAGRFSVEINAETVGQVSTTQLPEEFSNRSIFGGPQVLVAPLPTSPVRPVFGGGILWWRGSSVASHVQVPDELPSFEPTNLLIATALAGVEARLSSRLDGYIHVPIQAVVGGDSVRSVESGGGALEGKDEPPSLAPAGAAITIGFQVRFLGPPEEQVGLEDMVD